MASLFAALGLAFATNAGAEAAGFEFSPLRVDLSASEHVATVSLTNPKDVSVRLEVEALTWGQRPDGQPLLAPSSALLVFPQLLTIPPHERRHVRVATTAPPEAQESSYKVSITEIGNFSLPKPGESHVDLALQVDLPVFIAPTVVRRAGAIAQANVARGTLRFSVVNTGTVHFLTKDVHVSGLGADMHEVLAANLDGSDVLAAGNREYSVVLPPKQCGSIRALSIHVKAGDQQLQQTLDVPAGACNS